MPVVNMACNNQWNSEENVSTEQNLSSMNQQASVNGKKSTEMHIQFQYWISASITHHDISISRVKKSHLQPTPLTLQSHVPCQWSYCYAMMLPDVCHIHREYSWRPQLLEARRAGCRRPGVRHVWAGAGPQHVAYMGWSISWQSPAYSLLPSKIVIILLLSHYCISKLINIS